MPYDIDSKLVIGVASSALFDLSESDNIFKERGCDEYRKYQRDNEEKPFEKGIAFPFIKRLLEFNKFFKDSPIEVVLLSRNDPDTGMRAFESIQHYNLSISRAIFLGGESPFKYIEPFNIALFLSQNEDDVKSAIGINQPAGLVLPSKLNDDEKDDELRIAFDFDGVIADDSAEQIYQQKGLDTFQRTEYEKSKIPLPEGPLIKLLKKLSFFQRIERESKKKDKTYKCKLKISLITSRNAPAHKRMINTLRAWNITPDQTFLLGGIDKSRFLKILNPHIFFDDQQNNLTKATETSPSVWIPFGKINKKTPEKDI